MWLLVYLCAWAITTVGVAVSANALQNRGRPGPFVRQSIAVLAGALWPLLAIAVVELIALVVMAGIGRARRRDPAAMPHPARLLAAH